MNDRYLEVSQTAWGKSLMTMFGLPTPPRLRRAEAGWAERPLEGSAVTVGAAQGSTMTEPLLKALTSMGAAIRMLPGHPGLAELKAASQSLKLNLTGQPAVAEGAAPSAAFVFDASGVSRPEQLREVYDFFQPLVSAIPANGRVLVIAQAPSADLTAAASASSQALSGFIRSFGKEIGRKGATVNLIEVSGKGAGLLEGPLRFFLTPHSAFVCGQVLQLGGGSAISGSWEGALNGKVALVTGAARGIGAAIAEVLAREGAKVLGVDRPQEEAALGETLSKIGGVGLAIDVTAADAGEKIRAEAQAQFGGLDIVVHNAGITRDKMLRNMQPHLWDQVLDVNLASILRMNEKLLDGGLKPGARMVCVSSIGGISGNAGQTNYGATKAGVIGYVAALAAEMAKRGGAVNAVAPGFIETQMTAAMPVGPREVGRRLNSLSQGGWPVDIAEAVAFLAGPQAAGVNGRTLRVCGQNFVGA